MTLAVLLLAPSLALTQTGRVFVTIDSIVANSDSVYLGSIQKAEFSERGDGFKTIQATLTAMVRESLKGEKRREIVWRFPTRFPAEILEKIYKPGSKFMFVSPPRHQGLRENLEGKMVGVPQFSNLPFIWFRIYELGSMDRYVDYDSRVFTADMRVVSSMDDVFAESKKAARKYPGTIELAHVALPHVAIRMCGDPNAYGMVLLPKDASAKGLAEILIKDPAKTLADARRKSKRVYIEPNPTPEDLEALRNAGRRLLHELCEPLALNHADAPFVIRIAGGFQ